MQVTAKDRGFYGGGIKEIGDTFTIEKKEHFSESWMVKGSEAPAKEVQKFSGYVAARGAAGKFLVKDAAGQAVGTFIGSKAEAEKEAARLNDGGDITKPEYLGQQDAGAGAGGGGGQHDAGDDDNGPDA